VYLELPDWARFWKRGGVGHRLYSVLWQLLAWRKARRLHGTVGFDLVHHVTFANVWLPALAYLPGLPFVLGPVAGGQRVPVRLYPALGLTGTLRELVVVAARRLSRLNPLVRASLRRATVILANNDETRAALPERWKRKTELCSHVAVPDRLCRIPRPARRPPLAVYAGRLHRFKGVELAIRALELAPEWQLLVIGKGPDEGRLRRIAGRSSASGRIRFVPWLSQPELWKTISGCRAFVFPTLKEGGGHIAAEAQALGTPVIAFAQGGPALLARFPGVAFGLVELRSPKQAVEGLAAALRACGQPRPAPEPDFGLERVRRELNETYRQARVRFRAGHRGRSRDRTLPAPAPTVGERS
jgi:glycosyltransferase involved in cell wall biosynthesis